MPTERRLSFCVVVACSSSRAALADVCWQLGACLYLFHLSATLGIPVFVLVLFTFQLLSLERSVSFPVFFHHLFLEFVLRFGTCCLYFTKKEVVIMYMCCCAALKTLKTSAQDEC